MRHRLAVLAATLALTAGAASSGAGARPAIALHRLNGQGANAKGAFVVQGYVVKVYTPPPCPAGAQCKPSMAPNVVLSEHHKPLATYALTPSEIIVFTPEASTFTVGKRYQMQVRVTDHKTTTTPLNDLELVRFHPLD